MSKDKDDKDKLADELKKAADEVEPKPALGKILNRAKGGEGKGPRQGRRQERRREAEVMGRAKGKGQPDPPPPDKCCGPQFKCTCDTRTCLCTCPGCRC